MSTDRFEAEILFPDPADTSRVRATLAAAGVTLKVLVDEVDPVSDTVFCEIRGVTELDEDALWIWLEDLIRPFGGEVEELGLSEEIARRLRVGAS
jgi:hypothetical protein